MKQADTMELVTEKIDQYNEILSYLDESSDLKDEVASKLEAYKVELEKEYLRPSETLEIINSLAKPNVILVSRGDYTRYVDAKDLINKLGLKE